MYLHRERENDCLVLRTCNRPRATHKFALVDLYHVFNGIWCLCNRCRLPGIIFGQGISNAAFGLIPNRVQVPLINITIEFEVKFSLQSSKTCVEFLESMSNYKFLMKISSFIKVLKHPTFSVSISGNHQ